MVSGFGRYWRKSMYPFHSLYNAKKKLFTWPTREGNAKTVPLACMCPVAAWLLGPHPRPVSPDFLIEISLYSSSGSFSFVRGVLHILLSCCRSSLYPEYSVRQRRGRHGMSPERPLSPSPNILYRILTVMPSHSA